MARKDTKAPSSIAQNKKARFDYFIEERSKPASRSKAGK